MSIQKVAEADIAVRLNLRLRFFETPKNVNQCTKYCLRLGKYLSPNETLTVCSCVKMSFMHISTEYTAKVEIILKELVTSMKFNRFELSIYAMEKLISQMSPKWSSLARDI